ncbi:MAG: hypothetical protein IAC54_02480 [Bacteroidetes bacterium]|uniref:Uncharacterized protein n=1 Tax=Candidatus Caccoplasma merdipullorum TaxID=2840718 RepID=A0A9D9H3H8_9BACT|nr:hypothetical protein [Candidatus Caccoplasma merdipullorum]
MHGEFCFGVIPYGNPTEMERMDSFRFSGRLYRHVALPARARYAQVLQLAGRENERFGYLRQNNML